MKRDEFWLGLCLLGILVSAGFFDPIIEKVNQCFLDVPVVPEAVSFCRSEQDEARQWIHHNIRFERRVYTQTKPVHVLPAGAASGKAPFREDQKRS